MKHTHYFENSVYGQSIELLSDQNIQSAVFTFKDIHGYLVGVMSR